MKFRDLRVDEIECRIGMIKPNGLSLLLYKDARCDMNILDETVGPENWQREHKEHKGNLFCGVSIWNEDKKQWVTKWDCGTESNTEKEKGEASDSFKRACVNWGIGRELYTSPFIWIPTNLCNIKDNKCYDRFEVTHINIENKQITELKILNTNTGVTCFEMKPKVEQESYDPTKQVTDIQAKSMYKALLKKLGSNEEVINYLNNKYGLDNTSKLTVGQYVEIAEEMKQR